MTDYFQYVEIKKFFNKIFDFIKRRNYQFQNIILLKYFEIDKSLLKKNFRFTTYVAFIIIVLYIIFLEFILMFNLFALKITLASYIRNLYSLMWFEYI